MSALAVIAAVFIAVGLIGVVIQLPLVLSHHINQPVQRARRVRALRRKLGWMALAVAVGLVLAYAALTAR